MTYPNILRYMTVLCAALLLLCGTFGLSRAQGDTPLDVRVIDSTTLIAKDMTLSLWGIEKIRVEQAVFGLKARSVLERKIGHKPVLCHIKNKKTGHTVKAQCRNSAKEDLSLFLLQQGYASADRAEIYGSIYEKPYLEAERQAQANEKGAWKNERTTIPYYADEESKNFLMLAFFLIAALVLALGMAGFYIMRGFKRVVALQNRSIDLAARERALKNRERHVIASIIYTEITSNKAKIEAYLTVYEEVLQEFNNPDEIPKYKKTGDIIQKQPHLDRVVFDGNTHKLDLFDPRLSSDIIHYYARIKTTPDYVEVTPDMPQEKVWEILEKVVARARKLDRISDKIMKKFTETSLIKPLKSL